METGRSPDGADAARVVEWVGAMGDRAVRRLAVAVGGALPRWGERLPSARPVRCQADSTA